MATHTHTQHALWPGPNCVLTEMQEFCGGMFLEGLKPKQKPGTCTLNQRKCWKYIFGRGCVLYCFACLLRTLAGKWNTWCGAFYCAF